MDPIATLAAQTPGIAPGLKDMMFMFLPMIVIFYFLLIRPQRKKQREHETMLSELKKGDKIITTGGLHGTVSDIKDKILLVKIADAVKVEVSKGCVSFVEKKAK